MKTKHILIKSDNFDGLADAAELLRQGEVVVFPTETVYGLGAAVSHEDGLRKIFETKGRPADNPLIVHIADIRELEDLVEEVSPEAEALIKEYWPGPLTLILKKRDSVSDLITAGLDTVAVRMPDNEVARALIKTLGEPIAAPSANISGRPSITRDKDLVAEFDGKVAGLVLSEPSRIGVESTVLDLSGEEATLLRPGYISSDDIERIIKKPVRIGYGRNVKRPKSPGMKYKHYAPKAKVLMVGGTEDEIDQKIRSYKKDHPSERVAIVRITPEDESGVDIKVADVNDYMHKIYSAFRDLDKAGADTILAQKPLEEPETAALIDRLEHASNYEEI